MKKCLSWLFVCQLFFCIPNMAQQQHDELFELTIGDSLPKLILSNVIHQADPTIEVGGANGKLLIIEFWATWCTPCVANMPKLDSLQKEFKKDVTILPVTYQTSEEVKLLFSKSEKLKRVSIPIVTSDNILRAIFPHKSLPHYVWVNQNGKIIAITGEGELNRLNIAKAIAEETNSFKVKKDIMKDFKRDRPLLMQDLGTEDHQIYFQSLLTSYQNGLPVRFDAVRNSNNVITKISMLNYSVKNLFAKAWTDERKGQYWERTQVLIEEADSNKVNFSGQDLDKYKDWVQSNSYCYEIIVPEKESKQIFQYMREDMEKYFPQYKAVVEKRSVRCLVLERTSSIDKLKSKGGKIEQRFDIYGGKMQNCKMGLLMRQLNHFLQLMKIPVVDATNYKESIDIELDANLSNLESLRNALQLYDLTIVEKDYEIDMLVIKDR